MLTLVSLESYRRLPHKLYTASSIISTQRVFLPHSYSESGYYHQPGLPEQQQLTAHNGSGGGCTTLSSIDRVSTIYRWRIYDSKPQLSQGAGIS